VKYFTLAKLHPEPRPHWRGRAERKFEAKDWKIGRFPVFADGHAPGQIGADLPAELLN
jgi:hypothetical protein